MDPASIRLHINELLAESVASATERERGAWPAVRRGTDGSVVLYGAGRLGRLCARALRRGGVTLRAFCDRDPQLHGTAVERAVVLSPEEAARQFGASALFVVAVWTGTARESMVERLAYLRQVGCRFVTTYAPLVWAFGREETPFHSFDLPSRTIADAPALRELATMFADPDSLTILLATLHQRLRGEFATASPAGDQYFPPNLFSLGTDEVVVDGGAYTGDTLAAFLKRTGSRFQAYHAFEPDRENAEQLRAQLAGLPASVRDRIQVHTVALHSRSGPLAFAENGGPTSMIAADGGGSVEGRPLDFVLPETKVTFLKLDVEGAEREALQGARAVIARSGPIAAVCVYHAPRDLWEIPLQLRDLLPRHRYFLRQHQFDGYELVAYAVSPERCARR